MLRISLLITGLLTTMPGIAQKNVRLQPKQPLIRLIDGNLRQAANQYKVLMGKVPADKLPKTYYANGDKLETSNSGWWTSGFYPGTLFYLYEFSHDTSLLHEAVRRLSLLEKEQFNKGTHDLGFMMFCSFGNARQMLNTKDYDTILMNSARSLAALAAGIASAAASAAATIPAPSIPVGLHFIFGPSPCS